MSDFSYHPEFLAGRYGAVVDSLEGDPVALPPGHQMSLLGAYCFLGRLNDAEALFARLKSARAPRAVLVAGRYFLGVANTRLSDYARARRLFARNSRLAGDSPVERFYVTQGKVFHRFYTGRVRLALRLASRGRKLALELGEPFALSLATDAYGQCRAVAGEIHPGLRLLGEARDRAVRLGLEGAANMMSVSIALYEAEFGLNEEAALGTLERRFQQVGTEDSYSHANVGLELARQYTLRGRFRDAATALEVAAPLLYRQQNRRQEIRLNLRLAELAVCRGEYFSARQTLRFLDRLLHREVDGSFAMAALGLERKIALAEDRGAEAEQLAVKGRELAAEFADTRDDNLRVRLGELPPERENREDLVHVALRTAQLAPTLAERLRALLGRGLLVAAAEAVGLKAGEPALALLPPGLGLLARDGNGIYWHEQPLSALQARILRRLARGGADKSALVEAAWSYRYDPLRHDPMVYSALSGLRKALGPVGGWISLGEEGYGFAARVSGLTEAPVLDPKPEPRAESGEIPLASELNHRQMDLLGWLREAKSPRYIGVGDCRDRYRVSEVTALRDLDGLRRLGFMVRIGKARATRYALQGATL